MKLVPARRWFLLFALVFAAAAPVARAQVTGGPYQFYSVAPCRLVDTRINLGATIFNGGANQNITVKTRCGIPSTAKVAVVNLVALTATADGFLANWPSGPYPGTSTLNFRAGEAGIANGTLAVLASGTPDLIMVYGTAGGGTCHVLVDVIGYYQ